LKWNLGYLTLERADIHNLPIFNEMAFY
jgi:hypothetical protein